MFIIYCIQCNKYLNNIKKAKAEHWAEWLKGTDESNPQQVSKFILLRYTLEERRGTQPEGCEKQKQEIRQLESEVSN